MRKPLVVGNWKMNGVLASARALAAAVRHGHTRCPGVEIALCPPFVHLGAVAEVLAGSAVASGAQSVCEFERGAYTGEVSAEMLSDLGLRYVIVGHSERRALFGESDERVLAKLRRAQAAGLTPILCVGETLLERQAQATETVIARQLDALLNAADAAALLENLVLAYEPVWAIGTGETATPQQAQAVHAFIRARIARTAPQTAAGLRVLYGGSVKPDNAVDLFAMPDIDGGLIGGAALKAEDFIAICVAALTRLTCA